jgi:hypothetical protein
MKKLTFIEKNDALVMLHDVQFFDTDCELLAKVSPQSKLQNEIAKANGFIHSSLQSKILMELLDCVTIAEIQEARGLLKPKVEKPKAEKPKVETHKVEKPKAEKPKAKKGKAEEVPDEDPAPEAEDPAEKKKDPEA